MKKSGEGLARVWKLGLLLRSSMSRSSRPGLALVWKWKWKLGLLLLLLLVCLSAGFTREGADRKVDPKKLIFDEYRLFTVDAKGEQTQFRDVRFGSAELEDENNSKRYWFSSDTEGYETEEGPYKGWKSGVYFFGDDGKFISCLEVEDGKWRDPTFSPDGKLFVLDGGRGGFGALGLYAFDGLQRISGARGLSPVEWLDNERFAFTGLDESRGPRGTDLPDDGWKSVFICGRGMAEPVEVMAATETEDYELFSVDRAAGELEIKKTYVSGAEDWPDQYKREETTIKIPIPGTTQEEE